MPLLTIARLTLREAARRRLLLAVSLLTLLVIGLTGWGFSRLATLQDNGHPAPHVEILGVTSGIVILVAYMFSFVLAIGSAFLAAPAIASDVESGLALSLLPRPMRRSDFVLGKWLGLAALLTVYTSVAGGLELAMIDVVTGYLPPHPILAIAFLIGQSLVLLTLALLASTRLSAITGGIIAVALFGVAWIAGIVTAVGAAFNNTALATYGTIVSLIVPTDGLWRSALFNLEPAAMVAASNLDRATRATPFVVAAPSPTPYLVWAAAWVVVMLSLAVRSFTRRDV